MSQLDIWLDDETIDGSTRAGLLTKAASKVGDMSSFEYHLEWWADRAHQVAR